MIIAFAKEQGIATVWLLWILVSCVLCASLAVAFYSKDNRVVFMPGPLSAGHHQLGDSCESCHSDAFGGGPVLQTLCIDCHGDDRKKPFDSHPIAKFKDPRNAARLEKINVTLCLSCHTEHRPEITAKNGLTQPLDVCFHCHEDIAEERPSHAGMAFVDCTTSGCHNYHDNRALYTDFLVKHMDQPHYLPELTVIEREFVSVIDQIVEYPVDRYPLNELTVDDSDEPTTATLDEASMSDWLASSHAKAGVNCSACHQTVNAEGELSAWNDKPGLDGCSSCHSVEVKDFGKGKHGMRLAEGLDPLNPINAQLPMHTDNAHEALTCNSCHGAHLYDVQTAAVDSCLGCHADEHSLAYKSSSHFGLWQAELDGVGEPLSGVSCATCHMPRVNKDVSDWLSRVVVEHNQSRYFSPNSKMIRPVCQSCHGLPFSISALSDPTLVTNNFQGTPNPHVESVDLARKDAQRHAEKKSP